MIGTLIGHYRLMERLGGGGTGEAYRAEHTDIGLQAAIKVLHTELCSDADPVARFFARFFDEARAAAAIRHPNIIEMLCGRPAFEGQRSSQLLDAHLNWSPPPIGMVCPGLPAQFDKMILRNEVAPR